MLALKKKREAEAAAAAAAAAGAASASTTLSTTAPSGELCATEDSSSSTSATSSSNKVSLIGAIGGKKTKDKTTESGKEGGSKKRTPGEIRIQKGVWEFSDWICADIFFLLFFLMPVIYLQQILRNWMVEKLQRLNFPIRMI